MCGRYQYKELLEMPKLAKLYRIQNKLGAVKPRWNVAPTQPAPVALRVGDDLESRMMRWGLVPSWSKDDKGASRCINARSETAATLPSFRSAFKHRRCLVMAHGYYEWQNTSHGKQPWHYQQLNRAMMCFAGLWEQWVPPEVRSATPAAPAIETFTILTTEPNALAAKLHDRMPVILPEEKWAEWIDPETPDQNLPALLVPFDAELMECWPVTPKMNTVRYESPECIVPVNVAGDLFGH